MLIDEIVILSSVTLAIFCYDSLSPRVRPEPALSTSIVEVLQDQEVTWALVAQVDQVVLECHLQVVECLRQAWNMAHQDHRVLMVHMEALMVAHMVAHTKVLMVAPMALMVIQAPMDLLEALMVAPMVLMGDLMVAHHMVALMVALQDLMVPLVWVLITQDLTKAHPEALHHTTCKVTT